MGAAGAQDAGMPRHAESVHHAAPEALFGREPLLRHLATLLDPAGRTRVVLLHGEAGAGKTALAAVVAAGWQEAGGRVLTVRPAALDRPLTAVPSGGTPRLLVLDAAGAALPADPATWDALLRRMGPADRLLVVARAAIALPVDDARLVELHVPPLDAAAALALLAREGLRPDAARELAGWAGGWPLLLVLGAQTLLQHPEWAPVRDDEPAALADRLARRLELPADEAGLAGSTLMGGPAARRELHAVARTALRAQARLTAAAEGRAADRDPATVQARAAALRAVAEQAVRDYAFHARLATSPLGRDLAPDVRVAGIRALIDGAVDRTFGDGHADLALREVLRAGYLEPSTQHERAAYELHLSRSTYYRKLRAALDRVAGHVAESLAAAPASASAPRGLTLVAADGGEDLTRPAPPRACSANGC
jgi:hypothetical protein